MRRIWRRRVLGVVAFLSAIAVSLIVVTPGEGQYPGGNGMIAYTNRVPGVANEWAINTINPDASGGALLLAGGANRIWSPDGNKILFNRFPFGNWADLYVMNLDGTGEQQLTSGFPAWSASWSPDGARIAYKHSSPGNPASGEIWTMKPRQKQDSDYERRQREVPLVVGNDSERLEDRLLSRYLLWNGQLRRSTRTAAGSRIDRLCQVRIKRRVGPRWSPTARARVRRGGADCTKGLRGCALAWLTPVLTSTSTTCTHGHGPTVSDTPTWDGPHERPPLGRRTDPRSPSRSNRWFATWPSDVHAGHTSQSMPMGRGRQDHDAADRGN